MPPLCLTIPNTIASQWDAAQDVLPSYVNVQANNNIFGFMKGLAYGATTPAGASIVVNHVVQLDATGALPSDVEAEAAYQHFAMPAGAPTAQGMIDLSSPQAATNASWDVGLYQGEPRVFRMAGE